MLEKLEYSQLEIITLHKSQVQWYEHEREIIVSGMLFDVESYSIEGDSVAFKGLFDKKETELKAQLRKMLKRSEHENAAREVLIAKILTQLWMPGSTSIQLTAAVTSVIQKHRFYSVGLRFTNLSTFTPPPEGQRLFHVVIQ